MFQPFPVDSHAICTPLKRAEPSWLTRFKGDIVESTGNSRRNWHNCRTTGTVYLKPHKEMEMDLKQILELHKKWLDNEAGGKRADLRSADLGGAYLSGAHLRGAYLSDADLRSADLRSADLSGADLCDADLWDVTGNKKEIFTFETNKYTVVIYQDRIQIGCKNFSQSEWFNFSDDEITEMDSEALDWWCTHKQHVKTWCEMVNSYSK